MVSSEGDGKKRTSFYCEMIDDDMAEVLRKKSEVERLRIAGQLYRSARTILRGAICTQHPEWSKSQVNREIANRISHGLVSGVDHDER